MSRLRQHCERRLEAIPAPRPSSLDRWVKAVAHYRGRKLCLRPMPGLSRTAPCGMWISLASTDYVFYEVNTSRLHYEHIILHELAHIISGHTLGVDIAESVIGGLLPDLDAASIRRILGRVGYTSEQEREAEMLASLMHAGTGHPHGGGRDQEVVHMADALHFPS